MSGGSSQPERPADDSPRFSPPPFRPAWWLRNRHLQTLFGPLCRRAPKVAFERERWETPDGDFLDLHFAEPDGVARGTVVLLHGLEGSIASHYMPGFAAEFLTAGIAVAGLEFRSCSGEVNRARRMYHSGETTDLDFVVRALRRRRPEHALFGVGVSLGGNVLAKWLGEQGDGAPLDAGVVIGPPFDLTKSGPWLDRVLWGVYSRHFLKSLIPKAEAKARQHPGCFDIDEVRRAKRFVDFDNAATAPLHGFEDAEDYWRQASSGPYLAAIRRPTLLIASRDDPFHPAGTLPERVAAESPHLVSLFTDRGGHIGFVEGRWPWRARYWAERVAAAFCSSVEAQRRASRRRASWPPATERP